MSKKMTDLEKKIRQVERQEGEKDNAKRFQFIRDEINLYNGGIAFMGRLNEFISKVTKARLCYINYDSLRDPLDRKHLQRMSGSSMEYEPVQIIRPGTATGYVCFKNRDNGIKVSFSFFDLYDLHRKKCFEILDDREMAS